VVLRIALVDDHRLMREGLKGFLRLRGAEVVGEGGTGLDAVRLAREVRPDVLLMDLSMPEMDGLEATRLIKASHPEQVVVILTASEAESDLFEAVKSGAQGYLLKSLDPEQLVGHLEAAARGEAALTPARAAKILTELARAAGRAPEPIQAPSSEPPTSERTSRLTVPPPATPPAAAPLVQEVEPLTARERDVLDLVVRGASNREIAEALVITENTVKYHLKNVLGKLHLRNRAQVVAYALRHGLDQP
jgi:DNA-binding NarL/FixJ family response regulator